MADMIKMQAKVVGQAVLSDDSFSMWLEAKEIVDLAKAGQFIGIYCKDGSRLLPRPISICELDKEKALLRIAYRVVGAGTAEYAKAKEGDLLDIIGPCGNGFTLQDNNAVLIGGGIGIPPLLEAARELDKDISVVLGYRDSHTFLAEEFEQYAKVYIATEDGSVGIKGNVVDVLKTMDLTATTVYACGPIPMLKAIKEYTVPLGIETQLSLEERMACSIGACLGCICHVKENGKTVQKRVCKDGPVFLAKEVEL